MNKLFTKVAALTLGVAMAAGVGVALGSAKASEAKADYSLSYTLDFSVASPGGTGTELDASTAKEFFNAAIDTDIVDSCSNVVKSYSAKGQGGSGIPEKVFKMGSSKAAGSLTFNLVSTADEISKAVFNAYNWPKKAVDITVNGVQKTKASSTTATLSAFEFEFTATRSIAISVPADRALSIVSIELYKQNGAPATQYNVTDSVENGSVSPSTVSEGATLTATITPDTGYVLPETVSVTMGGTAATHTYQNGVVTVENVTGDIVISGSCVAMPSPEHAGTAADPYTVSDAYKAINKGTGTSNVYVRGITAGIVTSWSEEHKNISFNISDDGSKTGQLLQAYRCVSSDAHTIASDADVPDGATVVIYGSLTKYNTTYEFSQGCYISSYTAPANPIIGLTPDSLEFLDGGEAKQVTVSYQSFGAQPTITVEGTPAYVSCQVDGLTVTVTPTAIGNETVTIKGTNGSEVATADLTVSVSSSHGHVANDPYTVAEALAAPLSAEVYVAGKISAVTEVSTSHGNATYNISDDGQDTNSMIIYRGKYINGADFTDASQIEVGGTVVVKGQLTQYQSKNQLAAGNQLVSYVAPAPTLESIAVSGEYKTKYAYQENFDEEGIVVTATYSDQSQQPVDLTDVEFSGYNKSVLGEQIVTVTYQEKTTTFKVTVYYTATYKPGEGTSEDGDYVEYIENPDNYELVSFEKTGFVAPTGKQFKEWSQGTTGKSVQVNGNLSFTAVYEDIPVQKFTITYKAGYGTGDDIVINDVEAGSSHILKTFAETQFVAPTGQQFKGWRVGSETELRDPGYEITNIQADVKIFANYENIPVTDWSDAFKAEYTSRFGDTNLPPFVDPVFAGDENTMYWEEGYPFGYVVAEGDYVQAALTAFVNKWQFVGDAQNKVYVFADPDMETFVDIFYDDGSTVILFTVIGNVALDTTGVKTEYFVGDEVDVTNLKVHPVLLNGRVVTGLTLPQNPYWSVSPSTFTEAGEQSVTVTVTKFFTKDIELKYNVTVSAVVAESISVSGQATKTSYNVGEEWSAEGLVVTAHYNNGTEADVTDQVTWSFDPAETAVEVTSVSAVAHLDELSSDAVVFDVIVEQNYDANAFAKDLLDLVAPICANYDGKKNNKAALKTVWDTMSQRYSTLSNEEKAKVIAAAAKADGTDLEKAMAFYNYACKKYGLAKFIEGRQVKALVAEHETGNSILPIVVIVASSVAAITAIGVVIALKRRKALLAK